MPDSVALTAPTVGGATVTVASPGSVAPITVAIPPTAAPTTAAPTTAPPTTAAPTTAPPTTAAPTTAPPTTVAVKDTWKIIDPASIAAPRGEPCCGALWEAKPSPPLPGPDNSALADGVYRVEGSWGNAYGGPLALTIKRFEACAKLPASACSSGETPAPTSAGVDDSSSYSMSLPLDGNLKVVFTGFAGVDAAAKKNVVSGSGADLAGLATAFAAAYQEHIASRLATGESGEAIAAALSANPAGGFGPAADGGGGAGTLSFTYGSAPPILMQGITADGTPGRYLGLIALIVKGGQPTLTVYGGFYS